MTASQSTPLLQPDTRRASVLSQVDRDLLFGNHLVPSDSLLGGDEENLITETWQDASLTIETHTDLKKEMLALAKSSAPLVVTFVLQNSLTLASILSVGHIGKEPLAGITLGAMTAAITGFAFIQGIATCLDTLCSQAYGAGKHELVGMHVIRCAMLAICCFIPIGFIWEVYASEVLSLFIAQKELTVIAGKYLRIVGMGIPGFILFECFKRFLQCQGVFHAGTYVLLICAPFNALMNYLLVWKLGFGYIGAPIAVTLNYWLMPLGLLIYLLTHREYLKCWPSDLTYSQAFTNWDKMIQLALPGVIMVEAEFIGFEVITISSAKLGTTALAAQSILANISALTFQIPFAIGIATATRVGNYIGAGLPKNGRISCDAVMAWAVVVGLFNGSIVYFFRLKIAKIYTNVPEVIDAVTSALIVMAVVCFVDCLNECSAGGMKGLGMQKVGGRITMFSFYCVGLPVSFLLCFKAGLGLEGLWIGIGVALTAISALQMYTVFIGADWNKAVEVAKERNSEHD